MSAGFVFPPPPPPPPKTVASSNRTNNPDRGRGRWPTRGRSRGAGPHSQRGVGRRQSADWDRPQQSDGGHATKPYFYPSPEFSTGHTSKRSHNQAFGTPRRTVPGGSAPPAVPSFGIPLPTIVAPKKPTPDLPEPRKKKERTYNQLGLTPRKEEHESSDEEDDADEEVKLAIAYHESGRNGLQFEHNGRLINLATPSAIGAWIAERKKRFPTKVRIAAAAAAKKLCARKEAAHVGLNSGGLLSQSAEHPSRSTNAMTRGSSLPLSKATQKRLPRSRNAHNSRGPDRIKSLGGESLKSSKDIASSETSSDGSSDDDSSVSSDTSNKSDQSDDSPLEQSSKIDVSMGAMAPPPPGRLAGSDSICRELLKNGYCRRGPRCRYSHPASLKEVRFEKRVDQPQQIPKPHKLLYDRLLGQQHDQEERELLRCIMVLGERGLLG